MSDGAAAGWGMGLGRVELPTSRLSGVRSNHLSYRPRESCNLAEQPPTVNSLAGLDIRLREPTTSHTERKTNLRPFGSLERLSHYV